MVSLSDSATSSASLPLRQTLISQTAQLIQDSISSGSLHGKLPAERVLCARYQVSRNTLRAALQRLQNDRIVEAVHGSGNYIRSDAKRRVFRREARDIALLSPEPLDRLRPMQALWIDELRSLLSERGLHLRVFHGRQWFRSQPARALERLVEENPHRCWILTLANAATQTWFTSRGLPCVVAGTSHAGLPLPSCDVDHRAMCRHAAGTLLGLGHRKIALLIGKSELAGDAESEAGFLEGTQQHLHRAIETIVCRHDPSPESTAQAVRQMMTRLNAPTGILVANAYHCLTVTSTLLQLGLRVPEDVSIISRDDDRFLSYVVPEPARYTVDSRLLAHTLLRMVLEQMHSAAPARQEVRLMPELIRGKSIAQPKKPDLTAAA